MLATKTTSSSEDEERCRPLGRANEDIKKEEEEETMMISRKEKENL
jgi:hypothetical protein